MYEAPDSVVENRSIVQLIHAIHLCCVLASNGFYHSHYALVFGVADRVGRDSPSMNKQPKHSPANMKRLEAIVVEPQVKFAPDRWRRLVEESETKRKHFDKAKGTRPWARWRELRGIVAEEIVSVYTSIPRHHAMTDGGIDFFKTDVKGIPPVKPVLAVVPVNRDGSRIRWKSEYYLCVVVDIRDHWGSILGWASSAEVQRAPLVQMPNALSHVVYPWDLHPGIPGELEKFAELLKATR